ncbi:hypothetical protein [Kitasatospora sp. NPDC057198]|uniref:hypothetical protein n=1 Tax=Kitasatospora sp. NPDC057198 TaxID=3346046 RepID=UPI0036415E49
MEFTMAGEHGTTAGTPLGALVLHRARPRGDAAALIEGLEVWRLELDGRPLAELPRFGPPGPLAQRVVRRTASGTFEGAELRVSGQGHLLRSRRRVEFRAGGRVLRFVRRGLEDAELWEDGAPVARRGRGWRMAEPDRFRVCAVAVYDLAALDHLVAHPVLRNL